MPCLKICEFATIQSFILLTTFVKPGATDNATVRPTPLNANSKALSDFLNSAPRFNVSSGITAPRAFASLRSCSRLKRPCLIKTSVSLLKPRRFAHCRAFCSFIPFNLSAMSPSRESADFILPDASLMPIPIINKASLNSPGIGDDIVSISILRSDVTASADTPTLSAAYLYSCRVFVAIPVVLLKLVNSTAPSDTDLMV